MFLVRIAFWITVVALLLPAPEDSGMQQSAAGGAMPASLQERTPEVRFDMADVAGAAMASAEDVLTFCERNPATCETGRTVAAHVQRQAFYYGGLALGWLAEQGSDIAQSRAQAHQREPLEASSPSAATLRGA